MRAFKAIGQSIVFVYDELFLLIGVSLVWTVAAIPLYLALYLLYSARMSVPALILLALLMLAIVPVVLGPATMGLFRVTFELANERRADMSMFWDGVREEFKPAWRTMLANLAIGAILVAEIISSIGLPSPLNYATLLWVYGLLLWLAMQLYLFPFLRAQAEQKTRLALRNSALTALANPLFTLILLIVVALLTILSIAIPILLVLLWPAVVAMIGSRALVVILENLPGFKAAGAHDKTKE